MILNKLFYSSAGFLQRRNHSDIKFKVMKTTYTYKFNRAIIVISILLLIISFAVNGQTRSGNREKSQYRTRETKVVRNENPKNQRTTLRYTRNDNRNNNSKNKIVKYESVNTKQGKNYGGNKNSNYYKHNKHSNHNYAHGKKYYKKYYDNSYYNTSPWAYYNYPVVFYHRNHGEYYFHGGRFYRYNRNYGYVMVDIPSHIVFKSIPHGYKRVYINGRLFYRYGDVFFKHTPHGYRISHQRPGVHFSASF